ncbi:hypothetical protein [Dyadobacter bucti]|jgi:hypothetical protein|uniref:hypothetical protein n=1 Tax=Dyadobacter bucti TaxID=2572203 RepID=UPI003F6ECC36
MKKFFTLDDNDFLAMLARSPVSNILAKYAMLGQSMPQIQELDGQFVVALPLIPAAY